MLLRWAMGLLDNREIDEVSRRQGMLRDQANVRDDIERLRHVLEASRPTLAARLGLREEDVTGELFALRGQQAIEEHVRRLQELADGYALDRELAALHDDAVRAAGAFAVAQGELARLRGL